MAKKKRKKGKNKQEKNKQIATVLEKEEQHVAFLISSCSDKGEYGIERIVGNAKIFIDKIQYFEKHTWQKLQQQRVLVHEKQDTKESKFAYNLIDQQNRHKADIIGDDKKPYYHIRLAHQFRILGYRHRQFFYITHIDPDHNLNKRK